MTRSAEPVADHAVTDRPPAPRPRGEEHAADHEGDEDGRRVEAAPRAGAHRRARGRTRCRCSACSPASRRASIRRRIRCCDARAAGRRPDAADRRHAPTRGCAAASTPTSSRAPAQFITEQPGPRRARSGSSAARAATSSGAAASTCCSSRSASSRSCGSTTRRRSRRPAIEAFTVGPTSTASFLVYNEFKSVMSQRVVVDQLLPIPQLDAAERRRTAGGRRGVDYLLRAVAAGDLRRAAAALRRGAGVPRAARVERRRSSPRR